MSYMAKQRTALVTGSSNGIGEAIVKRLASLNYRLVVTGRDVQDIQRVANECALLSPSKSKPLEVIADLESETSTTELLRKTLDYFDNKLNLLVNNAGVGIPVPITKPEACFNAYKKTMQINLQSVVYLTTMFAAALKKAAEEFNETSSVIIISSIAAFRPSESLSAYAVSKAGLNMYAQSMAVELAPSVRVNCISPGPIETKIVERAGFPMDKFREVCSKNSPLGRTGVPDEVAEIALYFADHERSSYVTGANMTIDGGRLLNPMKWTE